MFNVITCEDVRYSDNKNCVVEVLGDKNFTELTYHAHPLAPFTALYEYPLMSKPAQSEL